MDHPQVERLMIQKLVCSRVENASAYVRMYACMRLAVQGRSSFFTAASRATTIQSTLWRVQQRRPHLSGVQITRIGRYNFEQTFVAYCIKSMTVCVCCTNPEERGELTAFISGSLTACYLQLVENAILQYDLTSSWRPVSPEAP